MEIRGSSLRFLASGGMLARRRIRSSICSLAAHNSYETGGSAATQLNSTQAPGAHGRPVLHYVFFRLASLLGRVAVISAAIYTLAIQLRSILLRVSGFALLVCTFSAVVSEIMPIRFGPVGADGQAHFSVWPPHWASWLALVGAPLALFLAGAFACIFVVLRSRQSHQSVFPTRASIRSGEIPARDAAHQIER